MPGGEREFFPSWGVASRTNEKGPAISTILPGKAQAIMSRLGIGRRSRSKVQIRVVGAFLIGWVEVLEAWGAEVEAVVVDPPDPFKHIRGLVSTTDTVTSSDAYQLLPLGVWDGCMVANLTSSQDSIIAASLFKRWRPAIVILSVHASLSRNDTLALLPSGIPASYQKKMITVCHRSVGGVTSASWRFVHYTRWTGLILYPSIMMSISLPRSLQTALSDT